MKVDPALVPFKTLPGGAKMPIIGMGTFGSDSVSADTVASAVYEAAGLGYRHFDCAAVYGNEREIGGALAKIQKEGVRREDLFITSKLWNNKHKEADVVPAFEKSLKDLGLAYLDLYLIHWPFPNHHDPGVDVHARANDAKPFELESYLKVWRKLEDLVDKGLVRNIGTSNMTIAKFEAFLPHARIKPAVNQMELHPHLQQQQLFDYVVKSGIQPVGFCPVGSPGRPERDRTPEDTVDMEDPVVVEIAKKHGVHPVAICLRWAHQRGQIPVPFSVKQTNLLANLKTALGPQLSEAEMSKLSKIDKNCRLVKGQVFLWKDGQTWEDLWDLDGKIKK